MKRVKKENVIFTMSKNHKPVETAEPGDTVVFETCDCYNNQIRDEDTLFCHIKKGMNNPATGPLYINGAEAGDILKIDILDISLENWGVMTARPGDGVLGKYFKEYRSKIVPMKDGEAVFNDKLSFPLNPMIGVIGVAPEKEDYKTTVPHLHGGNMDCKRIVKGSTVYLPVLVEGALLSIGDLHGVMGDGEIVICALEAGGEVTVKVDVIKNRDLPLPMVVEGQDVMTIVSMGTLDDAAKAATEAMHKFLTYEVGMDLYEAGMLLSLIGQLKICQVVDPLMTARMELPLYVLNRYGYKLP